MCGFAGLLDPDATLGADGLRHHALAMAATLAHRGPDDEGVWLDEAGTVALGHRRLAVLELSPLGAQPMVSRDGRWVLAYNGEIYNHAALGAALRDAGTTLRGGSDTEVLLETIASLGLNPALERAEGMFAFALWDAERRELSLVRDRLGEKPLYYGWVSGRLAFGSELKALRSLPAFRPELDRQAVALYLRHNCVPAPRTIYAGISKLLPGQGVTFRAGDGADAAPRGWTYWSVSEQLERARRDPLDAQGPGMLDALEGALSGSVAARMVADVPVGAFLSGGVDSSLIVALMQQHATEPVRTFTVGFEDAAFDESPEAAAVAAHLGCEHSTLRLAASDGVEVVGRLPEIWDEPFGDVSAIPMHLVSRLAAGEVTVALSGDGGDELFAGYNRHAWLERLWRRTAPVPAALRHVGGRAMARIPPSTVERAAALLPDRLRVRNPALKVAKVAKVLAATSPEEAYLSMVSYFDDAESMVIGAGSSESLAARPADWPALGGFTEQMLFLDLTTYLPDDILTKLDRAAMSVSLETRAPFLDRGVVELAWRLPLSAKLHGTTTKWALRQVLARHVPLELVDRPKMGFGFPIGELLRGELRAWADSLLDERRLAAQGLLDPTPIVAAWQDHLAGRQDRSHELWALLALLSWLERWLPDLGVEDAAPTS
jgi:asparagine synthase (glutamine-hydrolysing)